MRKLIDPDDYLRIKQIARNASSQRDLNYTKCYLIVLVAFLVRKYSMKVEEVPPEIRPTIELLIKPGTMSLIHYLNSILYSNDKYAKAITCAEFDLYDGC